MTILELTALRPAPPPTLGKQLSSETASPTSTDSPIEAETSNNNSSSNENGPTHYGTRSRKRPGTSRPNYAEDKDIDSDYLEQPSKASRNSTSLVKTASTNNANTSTRSSHKNNTPSSSSSTAATSVINGKSSGDSPSQSTNSNTSSSSKKRKTASSSSSTPSHQTSTTNGQQHHATNLLQSSEMAASEAIAAVARATSSPAPSVPYKSSNVLSFEDCGSRLQNGQLIADDGTVLAPNDHVYLLCEPPGEPYYLARIMEFLHMKNDSAKPIDAVRVNWYYRPKDIGKTAQDTRQLLATMHSDVSPLTALRGKCNIRHKSEIESLDAYRKIPDSFWYEKLYDRYLQKYYDVIPTSQVINVPSEVKKVLDEHWRFILVEQGRSRDLTAAVKLCKKCNAYCANHDSVDCSDCKLTYHMNCVVPPVLKKPSRGFGWSCAACSRRHEKMLYARNQPDAQAMDLEEDEFFLEEVAPVDPADDDRSSTTPHDADKGARGAVDKENSNQSQLWLFRYLGVHCKVEDVLDLDDRIYPRSSMRVSPRHQANVPAWFGRPVVYEKPMTFKKPGRREPKMSKEALAAMEAEKQRRENRPKWVQDEPPGYVPRGEDYDNDDPNCTATVLWKPPALPEEKEQTVKYMEQARSLAPELGLPKHCTNLQDIALQSLYAHDLDAETALVDVQQTAKDDFKEPVLSSAEKKKFEEGVAKYGSELLLVKRHVKTVPPGDIVRYYYTWKKTSQGKKIWGTYSGRKGKRELKKADAATKLVEEVVDAGDDSAFDNEKASTKKKAFVCQFCSTKYSPQWRRGPNFPGAQADGTVAVAGSANGKNGKDKSAAAAGIQYIPALCRRCAELWRRYAIQWESFEDVAKKMAQSGSRAWKRRQDEEFLKELILVNEAMQRSGWSSPDHALQSSTMATVIQGKDDQILVNAAVETKPTSTEPPRKKLKGMSDKGGESQPTTATATPATAKSTTPTTGKSSSTIKAGSTGGSHDASKAQGPAALIAKEEERLDGIRSRSSSSSLSSVESSSSGTTKTISSKSTAASRRKEKTNNLPQLNTATEEKPAVPDAPQFRKLPCAICSQTDIQHSQLVSCRDCRLTVHRGCYGSLDGRGSRTAKQGKWICDTCSNDHNPHASIHYACVLCPVDHTETELFEMPPYSAVPSTAIASSTTPASNNTAVSTTTTTSRRKAAAAAAAEKNRDRDRQQQQHVQELLHKATLEYKESQEDNKRPVSPREALKQTSDHNWVHVSCAVWTPEIKFSKAEMLVAAEGLAAIAHTRFQEVCTVCSDNKGACIACHHCKAPVHVECARQHGYTLGFELVPIKSSRRDTTTLAAVHGESGVLTPQIWCAEHVPTKRRVFSMHEIADEDNGLTVLQVYVRNYKQVPRMLTSAVRKANLLSTAASKSSTPSNSTTEVSSENEASASLSPKLSESKRRIEALHPNKNATDTGGTKSRSSMIPLSALLSNSPTLTEAELDEHHGSAKACVTCGIDVSLRWWPYPPTVDAHGKEQDDSYGAENHRWEGHPLLQCHTCHKSRKRVSRASPVPVPASTTLSVSVPTSATASVSASTPILESASGVKSSRPGPSQISPSHAMPQSGLPYSSSTSSLTPESGKRHGLSLAPSIFSSKSMVGLPSGGRSLVLSTSPTTLGSRTSLPSGSMTGRGAPPSASTMSPRGTATIAGPPPPGSATSSRMDWNSTVQSPMQPVQDLPLSASSRERPITSPSRGGSNLPSGVPMSNENMYGYSSNGPRYGHASWNEYRPPYSQNSPIAGPPPPPPPPPPPLQQHHPHPHNLGDHSHLAQHGPSDGYGSYGQDSMPASSSLSSLRPSPHSSSHSSSMIPPGHGNAYAPAGSTPTSTASGPRGRPGSDVYRGVGTHQSPPPHVPALPPLVPSSSSRSSVPISQLLQSTSSQGGGSYHENHHQHHNHHPYPQHNSYHDSHTNRSQTGQHQTYDHNSGSRSMSRYGPSHSPSTPSHVSLPPPQQQQQQTIMASPTRLNSQGPESLSHVWNPKPSSMTSSSAHHGHHQLHPSRYNGDSLLSDARNLSFRNHGTAGGSGSGSGPAHAAYLDGAGPSHASSAKEDPGRLASSASATSTSTSGSTGASVSPALRNLLT